MGRFTSPDFNESGSDPDPVPYADYTNPQSLNLYAYVNNNPLSMTDPDGHGCFDSDATSSTNMDGDLVLNGNCDWGDFLLTQTQVSQFIDQVKNTAQQAASQAPSSGVLHSIVCGAFSGLVNAAGPQNLNSTIGVAAGGSAGAGFILGIAASAGIQAVADSSGNLGVAFNFGGNPGYGVFGAGATGGVQRMYSTASSIYGLRGGSIGAGVSAFNGELDGSVGGGGVVTGTVTAGAGVGTKGAALSLNYTFIPSALSTNCRQ